MKVKARRNVRDANGWHVKGEVFETEQNLGDAVEVLSATKTAAKQEKPKAKEPVPEAPKEEPKAEKPAEEVKEEEKPAVEPVKAEEKPAEEPVKAEPKARSTRRKKLSE